MVIASLSVLLMVACGTKDSNSPSAPAPPPAKLEVPSWDPVTRNILLRKPVTPPVEVKQILITYGKYSPRFGHEVIRTQKDAALLVKKLVSQIESAKDRKSTFDSLMRKYSDDPDTGPEALSLIITPDGIPSQPKQMALHLLPSEVAVAQSDMGYHIIYRLRQGTPKPVLMSEDILKRPEQKGQFLYKQIIIGWRDLRINYNGFMTKAGAKRSRQKAYRLAKQIFDSIKNGESVDTYMKLSEKIPKAMLMVPHVHGTNGSHQHDNNKIDIPLVRRLVARLKPGEVGVITTPFGYHIIKRIR